MPTHQSPPIVELRQYTHHPGKRDVLIDLFERSFVEAQEAAGIQVLGQFRDLDDPNRFAWLRGFADMPARGRALTAFYEGSPVWKVNRDAANATIVDSDDVLLLHRVGATPELSFAGDRPAVGAGRRSGTLVVATVYLLTSLSETGFPRFFEQSVQPILEKTGAAPILVLASEHAENSYPRLPIRGGDRAFVWLAAFPSAAAYDARLAALAASKAWKTGVEHELANRLKSVPQRLRLEPTERSLLGNVPLAASGGNPGLPGYTTARTGDVHDFDFLEGEWDVTNRRLATRGAGRDDWEEFPATHAFRRQLGGLANVDEMDCPTKGWKGMTVRTFDVAKRQWSIYWVSSRKGALEPPVVGGFEGDRGEFYGEDEEGGRPVKVRFVWSKRGKDGPRWEQSFSFDGTSWEVNWVMEFRKKAATP